jgi:hypothetical protein
MGDAIEHAAIGLCAGAAIAQAFLMRDRVLSVRTMRRQPATTCMSMPPNEAVEFLGLALAVVSLLYSYAATMLIVTNHDNLTSCVIGIHMCACLYSSTKLIIYLFLIEKVRILSPYNHEPRNKSWSYIGSVALLAPYGIILVLMLAYEVSYIERPTDYCVLGIERESSLPLIIYDTVYSIYLTSRFLMPLMRHARTVSGHTTKIDPRLRRVAVRNLKGAIVSLVSSFGNILSLVLTDGRMRGLYCLAGCTLDVLVNCLVIHALSRKTRVRSTIRIQGDTPHASKSPCQPTIPTSTRTSLSRVSMLTATDEGDASSHTSVQ